jgi:YidC/Oxa1 family membrane protein insertase
MLNILYSIIIFPIIQLIELCYLFTYRIFHNLGLAVCGVSLTVSLLTLPLYFIAEKWQENERLIQKKLKPKIDKIKTVFKGDEQYMILTTYYRQNHYHPIYALRNSFSLLIQIPFFIAAYSYLSRLEGLKGASFFFISNLGAPDGLLNLPGLSFSINILPIAMTIINISAGIIYTRGFLFKDKVQLHAMALVFLLLLYNSPSGLVLYWTLNNVFSLFKNILKKTKHTDIIIYTALAAAVISLDFYVIFIHIGYILKRIIIACCFSSILFYPLLYKLYLFIIKKINFIKLNQINSQKCNYMFIFGIGILFLLSGITIPGSLIASSVSEFSFIGSYKTPYPLLLNTVLQSAGFFLFWPACIYLLFPGKTRKVLACVMIVLSFLALCNVFLFNENYGFLTNTLIFSEPKPISQMVASIILDFLALLLITVIISLLFLSKRVSLLLPIQIITFIGLLGLNITSIVKINRDYKQYVIQRNMSQGDQGIVQPLFSFSENGRNVLFIMLDRALSGYVPHIFAEKPEFLSLFSGFTYYPNCISFATHTLVGAPPLYGGYEYTPLAINKRESVSVLDKHKEAFLLLPRIFSKMNYLTALNDPPFDNYQLFNLSIYEDYPDIHAENLRSRYSTAWTVNHPEAVGINIDKLLQKNLIRFSFFKISPLAFKYFIYDRGDWLTTEYLGAGSGADGILTQDTIDDYVVLDLLPRLTKITKNGNAFNMVYSRLPHSPSFLQGADYIPTQNISEIYDGPFADDNTYHVNMASFILIGKWFQFLKENNLYNNTKIIMVSDHGISSPQDIGGNIRLPNGQYLLNYNSLLMYKDFDDDGELVTNNDFMTSADAPLLTLKGIVDNPVNPFTNVPLKGDKADGATIATISTLNSTNHYRFKYRIGQNEWLHVKDNIFNPDNWQSLAIQP